MSVSLRPFLALIAVAALAAERPARVVESIVPSLSYGAACWSSVELHNLGDRSVEASIEAHRASGALSALVGRSQNKLRLGPGERLSVRADIQEDTTAAWASVRETMASPDAQPEIAVSGKAECVDGDQLRTASREIAYPLRNPWYSGEVDVKRRGALMSLINASDRVARVAVCYSSGSFYSVPARDPPRFETLCSAQFEEQVPPFGSRQYRLERDGNSQFSIRTQGNAIVLQILEPVDEHVKLYHVDSSITFGGEAAAEPQTPHR